MLNVEVAELPEVRESMAGLKDRDGPEGETVAVRLTLPTKPFSLFRVMIAFPEEPCNMVTEDWAKLIAKSRLTTITATLAV